MSEPMRSVLDLLQYHGFAPSRATPPIPLTRKRMPSNGPRIVPAPIIAIVNVPVTRVEHRAYESNGVATVGVARRGVTEWRAAAWT